MEGSILILELVLNYVTYTSNAALQQRYILNFLRNGELFCPEDRAMRNELLAEAKFYQVQGIITQLEGNISLFETTWT